jgi:hypothetical protein
MRNLWEAITRADTFMTALLKLWHVQDWLHKKLRLLHCDR